MSEPSRIAVVGGGLMGVAIAQTFAAARHPVVVCEPNDAARASLPERLVANLQASGRDVAIAGRVRVVADLAEAVADADFVTEAAPERLELKRAIFAQLVELAPPTAILASNTSVIPVGDIAQGLAAADRIVGTHWWNPAHLIPLVEVVQGAQTSLATIETTMALLASIGKAPAHVRKDIPGFVANRLQHALWREAIAMVADGVCDAATIDSCVKNSFGLRLAVLGPLETADLVGLDLTLDIHKTIINALDRHDGPHEFLEAKVAEGKLGFKSGEGFRAWRPEEMTELRQRLTRHLVEAERARSRD